MDFQVLQVLQIQHLLQSYDGPFSIHWGEPVRSQGSDADHPRLCIQGFLPVEVKSSLEARVISCSLQEHLRRAPCLVGLVSSYKDCEALKFEITEAQAAVKFRHMFWDCLLISPTEALVRTECTANSWQAALSLYMREEPGMCGLKLNWKPSVHGGRIWAQPIAVEKQIQAVKTQASIRRQGRVPGSEPKDFESSIQIQGPMGPDPAGLMRSLMCTLNDELKANLKEQKTRSETPHNEHIVSELHAKQNLT